MKFNKDQREGLAKVADNLATASAVSAVVATIVEHKIGWDVASFLVIGFFVLLYIAYRLRKGDSNDN